MTVIKICGLRDVDTAAAAAAAGADMIGMVFASSKRQVTPEACHDIVETLREPSRKAGPVDFGGPAPGEVSARTWFHAWSEALEDSLPHSRPLVVGVFADQPVEEVNDIADAAGLDLVQLSGNESIEFAAGVSRPVILVRHVTPEADPDELVGNIRPGPVALLLDSASGSARGGTGRAFDWGIAAEAGRRMPLMLAGGLNPENVSAAIEKAAPWGVDVSSGVETNGAKDIEKVKAFIRAAKGRRGA